MAQLEPHSITNFSSGLLTKGAVSDSRMPLDACREVQNFHFDEIGAAVLRKGITKLGDDLSGNILGLFEFRDSGNGTNNQIIAVDGTTAYYLSGGVWTSKRTGLTSGSKARFSTFLDYVFMVNGTEATAVWDGGGGTFATSGNASGAPTGKFIENFRARMWIAGNSTYPDRLYFSSLPSSVTTPLITWDTSVTTGDWIDISPSDGENITGLHRTKSHLLVFKNNHIYRVASISQSEPDPSINVGTYSQESIVETKIGVLFHHPTGFFRYSDGGAEEISRPIIDIVEAISLSNYSSIAGWEDGDHAYWSVGDITINSISYTNVVVRYTISTQVWTMYTYPTQFRVSSPYNDGTTLFQIAGGSNGKVYKINVGITDDSAVIPYSLTSRSFSLDGFSSTRKTISKMVILHDRGTGGNFSYQNEEAKESDWTPITQLQTYNTPAKGLSVKGKELKFRISGNSSGEPFSFQGLEIIESSSELII